MWPFNKTEKVTYTPEAREIIHKAGKEMLEPIGEKAMIEMFSTQILYARDCMKAVLIVNSGAIIVILAFIGNSISKIDLSTNIGKQISTSINNMPISIACFCAGIIFSGAASGLANISQEYYNQSKYYQIMSVKYNNYLDIFDDPKHKHLELTGNLWKALCIILIVLSYLSFVAGSYFAYIAFPKF